MQPLNPSNSSIGRKIKTRLTGRSLAPHVHEALTALGYCLEDAEKDDSDGHVDSSEGIDSAQSRIWLTDEKRLDELPGPTVEPDARILLISSPSRTPANDRRVLARATRPGRLSDVYSMIQGALEATPRKNPRIRTKLSARCLRADRRSLGALLSLSEGGCLLRCGERLRKGARLDLQFALPNYGLVSTAAECRYVRMGEAGLEFREPPGDVRQSIARYVTQQLAEHADYYAN